MQAPRPQGSRPPFVAPVTAREIVELCFDPYERSKWALMCAFPHLAPWASLDDLTNEESLWVTVMRAIDDGLRRCSICGEHGYGAFCGACGSEHGTTTECGKCGTYGMGAFCTSCGQRLANASSLTRDIMTGKRTFEELDAMTRKGCEPKDSDSYQAWLEESLKIEFQQKIGVGGGENGGQ